MKMEFDKGFRIAVSPKKMDGHHFMGVVGPWRMTPSEDVWVRGSSQLI
jgi:hypothetical protein